jgi:hypothetical protein
MAGGSLICLNGLFFANFGYLLSASYLSYADYVAEIIELGVGSLLAGLAVIMCGIMLGIRPIRRILLGATILTLSVLSTVGFLYYYTRLGFYSIYPTGLSLGNIIGGRWNPCLRLEAEKRQISFT